MATEEATFVIADLAEATRIAKIIHEAVPEILEKTGHKSHPQRILAVTKDHMLRDMVAGAVRELVTPEALFAKVNKLMDRNEWPSE